MGWAIVHMHDDNSSDELFLLSTSGDGLSLYRAAPASGERDGQQPLPLPRSLSIAFEAGRKGQ